MTGMESDPCIESIVRSLRPEGIRIVSTLTSYIGDLSDYHSARLDRRPYLFLTCGRWEHYHCESDTPEKLNYEKIGSILDLVVDTVVRADRETMSGPFEGNETLATELELMNQIFGPDLLLTSRSDVDHLVQSLVGAGV